MLYPVAQLSVHLSRLALRERYCKQRVSCFGEAQSVALARWRFAAACIRADLGIKRRWHPWTVVQACAQRRREYLKLWRAVLLDEHAVGPRLLQLEEELGLSDILFFRAIAEHSVQQTPAESSSGQGRGTAAAAKSSEFTLADDGEMLWSANGQPSPPRSTMLRSASETQLWASLTNSGLGLGRGAASLATGLSNYKRAAWFSQTSVSPHPVATSHETSDSPIWASSAFSSADDREFDHLPCPRPGYSESGMDPPLDRSSHLLPLEWHLRLSLQSIRVHFYDDQPAPQISPPGVVQLVATLHVSECVALVSTDVTGHHRARLSAVALTLGDGTGGTSSEAFVSVNAAGAAHLADCRPAGGGLQGSAGRAETIPSDGSRRRPLLSASAGSALSLMHEAWPASAASIWPLGGHQRPAREAGSRLSLAVAPLHARLLPSRVLPLQRCFTYVSSRSESAPPPPMPPASPSAESLEFVIAGALIELAEDSAPAHSTQPERGSPEIAPTTAGGSVLQALVGSLRLDTIGSPCASPELSMGPRLLSGRRSQMPVCHQQQLVAESLELRLKIPGCYADSVLVPPFDLTADIRHLDGDPPQQHVDAKVLLLQLKLTQKQVVSLAHLLHGYKAAQSEVGRPPSKATADHLRSHPLPQVAARLSIDCCNLMLCCSPIEGSVAIANLGLRLTTTPEHSNGRRLQLRTDLASDLVEVSLRRTPAATLATFEARLLSMSHAVLEGVPQEACSKLSVATIRFCVHAQTPPASAITSRASPGSPEDIQPPVTLFLVSERPNTAGCSVTIQEQPNVFDASVDVTCCTVHVSDLSVAARPIVSVVLASSQLLDCLQAAKCDGAPASTVSGTTVTTATIATTATATATATTATIATVTNNDVAIAWRLQLERLKVSLDTGTKCNSAIRSAVRQAAVPAPSLTVQISVIRASFLSDRVGGVNGDFFLQSLGVLSTLVSLPDDPVHLMKPLQGSATWRSSSASLDIQAQVQDLHITFPRSEIDGLNEFLMRCYSTRRAADPLWLHCAVKSSQSRVLQDPPSSFHTVCLDASIQSIVLSFAASTPGSLRPERSSWLFFAVDDAFARLHTRGSGISAMFDMQVLRVLTAASDCEWSVAPELAALGSPILEINSCETAHRSSDRNASKNGRICFSTELTAGSMLVEGLFPPISIHADLEVMEDVLPAWAPWWHAASSQFQKLEASDAPFVLDISAAAVEVVLLDKKLAPEAAAHCSFSLLVRLAMSGGVEQAARMRSTVILQDLTLSSLRGATASPVLSPCNLDLRLRSHAPHRIRGALSCSDIQLQAPYSFLLIAIAFGDRCTALISLLEAETLPDPWGSELHSPRTPSSTDSDTTSECSEYFDALEENEHLLEPMPLASTEISKAAPVVGSPGTTTQATDVRFEFHFGRLMATAVDDYNCVGAPFLQLNMSAEPALLSRASAGSGLCLNLRIRVSLNHFKRQLPGAPQGWEPVLVPCGLDIKVDWDRQTMSLGSRGLIQVDVSSCLLRSMLGLQQRLLSSQHVTSTSAMPFARFRLLNDTGCSLLYAFDGDTPTELPAAAMAACAHAPSSRAQGRALQVVFDGFQAIELRPPYRDRYRLWPVAYRGTTPPILYVLASSSIENASDMLKLRSPFAIENCCPGVARVSLSRMDGDPASKVLLKKSFQIETAARCPVPLSFLPSWLEPEQPHLRLGNRSGTPPQTARLELALAPMQALRTRGTMLLGDGISWQKDAMAGEIICYSVTTSYGACGWLIKLHAPLVLLNGLLCALEYELSDTSAATTEQSRAFRGSIERDAQAAFYRPCHPGCYLRVRCAGFRWSQPIDVGGLHDDSPVSTHALRCPPVESDATHFGPVEHGAPGLSLDIHVQSSPHTIVVEVCGRVWLVNECHLSLRYQPVGAYACSMWQHLPSSSGTATTPVPLTSLDAVCGEVLISASSDSSGMTVLSSNSQTALLSIPELLQSEAQSEDFLLDVPMGEGGPSAADPGAEGQPPRTLSLHLGAKLMPLQHKLGRAMLLTIAPRFILVNLTSRPIQVCQPRDCDALPHLLLPSLEKKLMGWCPVHWQDSLAPRHVLVRRTDRGAEWSGAVPLTFAASAPAELTLRLRNLESGAIEFPRLSLHRLQGRATIAGVITEELPESAPVLIQNLTTHPVRFKQSGVSVLCTVPPGGCTSYAWDEPTARQQLQLDIAPLGVHFRCDLAPRRMVRPLLASLRRRCRVELCVLSEGAVSRFVLRELQESQTTRISPLALRRRETTEAAADGAASSTWQLSVEMPGIGITLIDDHPRELLHGSLRGLRFTARAFLIDRVSMGLAIASIQLDCQLPRESPREEVLLQLGVATREDAINAQMSLSHGLTLPVLHQASVTVQELTLRLDEDVIDTVAVVIRSIQAQLAHSQGPPRQQPSTCATAELLREGLTGEIARVSRGFERLGQRLFVKRLKLDPVKLKLTWRSSRPDAPSSVTSSDGHADRAVSASLLRWLRWLGITLIGLEDAPACLPEVVLNRAVLPLDSLLSDLQLRYSRALIGEAQKLLLTSVAVFGDPYGTLRTLRQAWFKQLQKLRRTPWRQLPLATTQSASLLLRASAANMLRASGRSVLALSTGLEALLSQEGEAGASGRVTLPDAIVQGVGGFARATAKGLEATLARANRIVPIPNALEGLFLTAMLPIGLSQGVQRLVILLALGALRTMRSVADVARGLLHSGWLPSRSAGRVRPARHLAQLQLVYPYHDEDVTAYKQAAQVLRGNRGGSALAAICCVECVEPTSSSLLVTRTALLCFAQGSAAVQWEAELADMLIMQQQGVRLRMLYFMTSSLSPATGDPRYVTMQEVELLTTLAAEDTYEILRVACLNARNSPMPPSPPCPLLRSVLLHGLNEVD